MRGRTVAVQSGGQPAATAFRSLQRCEGVALVEACPETGRTHQIRAHLAGAGFPILGDVLYGGPRLILLSGGKRLVRRHLLHAFRLTFRHPDSGESLTIEAPVPADIREVLDAAGISAQP